MLPNAIHATLKYSPPQHETQQAMDNYNLDEENILSNDEVEGRGIDLEDNLVPGGWLREEQIQSKWWKRQSPVDRHFAYAKLKNKGKKKRGLRKVMLALRQDGIGS